MIRRWTMFVGLLAVAGLAVGGELGGPYVDERHLTAVHFGAHSHWAQPWRSFLETVPAQRFLDGIGVGFTAPDGASEELIAQMLARHGVRHARIEIGWGSLTWEGDIPPHVRDRVGRMLLACQTHGIRPLILLNAHHGAPCPTRFFERELAAPVDVGATTIELTDVSELVVGASGVCGLTDYWACEALITAIEGNTATLSKPLPKSLGEVGARVPMATLKHRPFGPPDTPEYADTLDGWVQYAATVADFVTQTLGTTGEDDLGFDMEVWNELSFGSNYLNINAYYEPDAYDYRWEDIWGALVQATAEYVEAHPEEFAGVRLCDGFSNTIPWPASSTQPARVSAMSKHPYAGAKSFPADRQRDDTYNALFEREESPVFYPTYAVCFPEYYATYLQTETVFRDLAPITTDIYGVLHGRLARTISGRPSPVEVWFTEVGWAPNEHGITDPASALQLKAKTTARYYGFFLGKGLERLYLYAACEGDLWLGVIQDNFVEYAQTHTEYPEDDTEFVSPALRTLGNMVRVMSEGVDAGLVEVEPIAVAGVSDEHDALVFEGDGTPEHPSLYHRDVLALLPFQASATRFVTAYYVQTRDVRHDLAPEAYTVVLEGPFAPGVSVSAYDPLTDGDVPAQVVAAEQGRLTVELLATDYPRLLVVER